MMDPSYAEASLLQLRYQDGCFGWHLTSIRSLQSKPWALTDLEPLFADQVSYIIPIVPDTSNPKSTREKSVSAQVRGPYLKPKTCKGQLERKSSATLSWAQKLLTVGALIRYSPKARRSSACLHQQEATARASLVGKLYEKMKTMLVSRSCRCMFCAELLPSKRIVMRHSRTSKLQLSSNRVWDWSGCYLPGFYVMVEDRTKRQLYPS